MQLRAISLLYFLFLLAACGCTSGQHGGSSTVALSRHIISADQKKYPQDLMVYAEKLPSNFPLIPIEKQREEAEKTKKRFFRPWEQNHVAPSKKHAMWGRYHMSPVRAFSTDGKPFPSNLWESLLERCHEEAFPSASIPAITVRNTSLRAMPTHKPYYRDPRKAGEGHPFDYFQASALWVGTPVRIIHYSKNREWVLVDTAIAPGWLPASEVAMVDKVFMDTWQQARLGALIQDQVPIWSGQGQLAGRTGKEEPVIGHIGTLLPIRGQDEQGGFSVLYPMRDTSGQAAIRKTTLDSSTMQPFPLLITAKQIAQLGNRMMAQPYGWGGLEENRDCSSTTRDLFLGFGLWLPRNSASQAAWGTPLILSGLSPQDKEKVLLESAPPFLSLVWLKGHIMLYVGEHKGTPLVFHSMWGVRTAVEIDGNKESGRAVIGKTVVTSLRPGAELSDVPPNNLIIQRVERVSILPEAKEKLPVTKDKAIRKRPPLKGKKGIKTTGKKTRRSR